ncbi:MAG: flagellar motor protein MotA [Alphaproteobacteria bacterium]|nr:flagellar motor protein MotA [Alphaproteobacteria bacterium]
MSRPSHYLMRMTIFVVVIALIAGALSPALYPYFMGNPVVNGVIIGILIAGVAYIFHQVTQLSGNARWLARASRGQPPGKPSRLLGSLARMMGEGRGRLALSAGALRTLLDSIGSRLEETRETSRYLIGLLIFLGLLGTFYGLLETVQSVKGVIGGLSAGGADPARAFADLKARLETPLGGMSTAFSASLFGLAGSLVLGFLDLQAGLAQNRFFNELEEWLTGHTRLEAAPAAFAAGEASAPAYIQALLEQTADTLDSLQRILSRGEESRISANVNIVNLTDRLAALTDQMRAEQNLMLKLAEQQLEMKPVLQRLADGGGPAGALSDETRGHLRAIEVHLARLAEDVSQGRSEAVQEIRSELRLVARTIAALGQEPERAR